MTQFEFYKSFQFVLELMLGQMMFMYRFRKRSYFWLRLPAVIALCFLFAWLFPVPVDNPFYLSFTFLMIFLFGMAMSKVLFKENWLTVAFCGIAGYTTQHMAYELYNLLLVIMDTPSSMGFYGSAEFTSPFPNLFVAVVYACTYVPVYFLSYIVFAKKLAARESVQLEKAVIFVLAVSILIVDIVLNAIVVYTHIDGAKSYVVVIGIYNILCCLLSLYLQFEVSVRKKLEDSLVRVEQMWYQAKSQYEISKENIEMINVKCHDLKHQIRTLQNGAISPEVLRDLENRIQIYDSNVKTGNDALDIILTEKSLLCNKNSITISIMADADKLGFMAKDDIYALFGNILDNAIEALLKVEADRRMITLNIKMVGDMLVIRESNCYDGEIKFLNGLPQSTKQDAKYHGYGLKSIQYIVDRYDGDLTVKADGGEFSVNILFFV